MEYGSLINKRMDYIDGMWFHEDKKTIPFLEMVLLVLFLLREVLI